MKRITLSIALLSAGLTYNFAHAQLAEKKGVTIEDINKHINDLAQKNDETSKSQMIIEAKALGNSKNEQFVNLGARIYEFIGKEEEAERIKSSILKKFPKGLKARTEALKAVFENEEDSFNVVEKKYNEWLKKYPSANFDNKNQEIYNQALAEIAIRSYKNDATQQGNAYVQQLQKATSFPYYAINIAKSLIKANKYQEALPIIESAYEKASQDQSRQGKYTVSELIPLYAVALSKTKQTDRAVVLLENYAKTAPLTAETTEILADGYIQQGKSLDAFLITSNFIKSNGDNEVLSKKLEHLYNQLNNNKGDYNTYATDLKRQMNEATIAKYKSEMIKKEAPNFSLTNMKGETVSLKDLKGKVVILDFWATWCGPCKVSFPGMQAAVNKFKDDNEVEFLFIDTWQQEKNYKEVVEKFITDNKYTFNVLFDEMKDRAKATTTAYGVNGIPHKVVIDKEGFIRFESSGGSSDIEKIVNEMTAKIDLAKKG